MDPGQQWGCSSFRTPMDSGAYNQDYRIFDAYLYDYLLKRNLHTTAQIFMQEAQIGDIRDLLHIDSPGGFLFDWWTIFYDSFTARFRFSGSQGNHTALFSQDDGQSSSVYDLPPLQPFPRDAEPMPLVPGSAPIPQGCTILESSSLVYGTTGVPPVWPAPHGSPQVIGSNAIPPARSTSTVSPLVSGAGEIPSVWWAHEGALVPATEQAPMPVNPMLNYQSPGSPSAVVLRTGNLNSASPALFPQPRPSRRGIRRGTSPNDPIDVETPMASPATAPRGRRPRRQLQSQSRGSSVSRVNVRPPAGLMRPPVSLGMSPAHIRSQLAQFQRSRPFPVLQGHSALMANYNGASGSLVPPSLCMGGQMEMYGGLLNTYQAGFALASNWNADAQNAAIDQNFIPMISGTGGLSAVPNPSSQGMFSEKNADGLNTETLGQLSATPANIASRDTEGQSNLQTDSGTEKNDEVSSAMQEQDTNMEGTDEDSEEDHKEDDTDVRKYCNDIYGTETGPDTDITAPDAPSPQPQPQHQPSQLIEVKNEVGLEFKQEACLESKMSELWCCHFSSSGEYLACAGVDRKVMVWNMATFVCTVSEEHHDDAISDIRFKPNSSIFASASFDKTIRIWDATKPENALMQLIGHAAKVTSVDFHPAQFDILSSCDGNKEIRFWHLNNSTCLHVTKGASQRVRFQPQKGKLLAAVTGTTINILDSETGSIMHTMKGHTRPIECICWDPSGRYLASASQEIVYIWSIAGWCNSTHKLMAENGAKFKSCLFHPAISHVLIIGSDKNIEIWNPLEGSKTLVPSAHESYVAGLTSSISTDIIASASHDGRVKLWK